MGKNDNIPRNPVKKAASSTSQSSSGNNNSGLPIRRSRPSTAGNSSTPPPVQNTSRPPVAGGTPRPPPTGSASRPPSAGNDGRNTQVDLKRFSVSYYDETGACKPYSPSNREFVLVADTYKIGLALLSRPDVEPWLVELGKRCVEQWTDPQKAKKYRNYQWPGKISEMNNYVHRFLTGVRNSPPRIIVDSSVNALAYTIKDVDSSYTGNLENFLPQNLVHFEIHGKLVESLKRNDDRFLVPWDPTKMPKPSDYDKKVREQNDRWQTLRFVIGITWFHELCHVFTTFLAGNNYLDTPPEVTNSAMEAGPDAGESGFWTETRVFGGCALMTPEMPSGDPEEDLKVYMVNDDDACRDVSTKTIKEFMLGLKTYDLKSGIKTVKPWKKPKKDTSQSSQTALAGPKSRVGIAAAKKFRCWDVRFVRAPGARLLVDAVPSQA